MFRRIAEGSLDAGTRRNLAAIGAEAAARGELDFYLKCAGYRATEIRMMFSSPSE